MNTESVRMLNIPICVELCIPSLDDIWLVNLFLGQPLIALSKQPFSLYRFIYSQQHNYVTVYCLGYCSFPLTSFFIIENNSVCTEYLVTHREIGPSPTLNSSLHISFKYNIFSGQRQNIDPTVTLFFYYLRIDKGVIFY